MPWKGVTVTEQRQRFIDDYLLNCYSVTELADRFSVSRRTAYKWINRYREHGQSGLEDRSRRPMSCPWQTDPAIVEDPTVGGQDYRPASEASELGPEEAARHPAETGT